MDLNFIKKRLTQHHEYSFGNENIFHFLPVIVLSLLIGAGCGKCISLAKNLLANERKRPVIQEIATEPYTKSRK